MVYFNSSANMCPKNWLHLKIIKYEGLISSILGSRLVSDSHQNKWLKCKEGAPQTVGLADNPLFNRVAHRGFSAAPWREGLCLIPLPFFQILAPASSSSMLKADRGTKFSSELPTECTWYLGQSHP